MNYKAVEGIDENGNPTTYKVVIPDHPELTLVSSDEKQWWWNEYIYEYRGYKLDEVYFDDRPECLHHSCTIYKGDKRLTHFTFDNCVEDAMKYVDELEGGPTK